MLPTQNPLFDPSRYVHEATQMAKEISQSFSQLPAGTVLSKPHNQMATLQPMLKAFSAATYALAQNPMEMFNRSFHLYQSYLGLMANFMESFVSGKKPETMVSPEKGDNRFNNPAWDNAYYDLLKQSYLLTSQWVMDTIGSAHDMPELTRQQALFFTRQFIDALAPSNFFITNPEALQTALSSKGQSVLDGFRNLMHDLQKGGISMTDYEKFQPGKTLAITPGTVVLRNKMLELIQYKPTTENVKEKPLLICPPWINRYYVLDLQPHNSLVKYLTDQGFQVFLISWKNPDASYRNVTFEDYITEGLLKALDATLDITGQESANVIGYCIGGTMTSSAVAALNAKAKGQDARINSVTLFTTLVDFEKAGELMLFTDEQHIKMLEDQMEREGVLNGRTMAGTFAALRANELIWSFVVNNYLLGKQPFPFDILYWNDDSTRMPAAMHSWYLRQFYLNNNLVKGKVELLGQKVDITNITQPMYMVSAINDHITPWDSCFGPFAKMKAESKRFILSKAGHVAGVVNPPTAPGKEVKRSFWAGEAKKGQTAQTWYAGAESTPDSWWPDFTKWLNERSGKDVKAPADAGNKAFKPVCPAPGTYVLEK